MMPKFDKATALTDIDRVLKHESALEGGDARVSEALALHMVCLERWAPPGTAYKQVISTVSKGHMAQRFLLQGAKGALRALRADVEADALRTFEETISAELFSDLISQGEHLLGEKYRLPAAVLIGASLEEHVKKLAVKGAIPLLKPTGEPVKTSNLNDLLAKAGAYSSADRDLVAGWLKIRNEAAHVMKEFEQRTDPEIRLMASGIRDFISRFPA
jgi:hypothetical protein